MKVCTRCHATKDWSGFYRRARSMDGFQPLCKQCQHVRDKARYESDQAIVKERSRKWVAEHPENRKLVVRKHALKRRYGLTLDDFNAILDSQGGRCAICPATTAGYGRRFYVDHDHATGKIRGLLCHGCNSGLGNFRDSMTTVQDAAAYLHHHGARP